MLKIMVKKTMRPIIFLEQKSKEVGLSNFTKKKDMELIQKWTVRIR